MRKALTVLIPLLLAASCRIVTLADIEGLESNPFMEAVDLSSTGHAVSAAMEDGVLAAEEVPIHLDIPSVIRIPVITDVHADRTGSGVHVFEEAFMDFLDKGSYPFIIDLGDLLNKGHYEESNAVRFYAETAMKANGNHIICIGNHELHDETSSSFDRLYSSLGPGRETMRMGRYAFGPLSIYKLDNSLGVFGRSQLAWLEEALAADPNPYRIFIAHENMATSRAADQSLTITGITDQREVHRMMRIMDEYGVSLFLTGHHHKGNIVYGFSGGAYEVNLAAFHRKESIIDFESDGYYYLLELDTSSGAFSIDMYSSETGERLGTLFPSQDG